MMKANRKFTFIYFLIFTAIISCGPPAAIISTPVENIDTSPLKVERLTKAEKENWGHLDLEKDTIPGMAIDRAYAEILKGKKGKTTIVAIIDSGIDIDHEDLDGVIWTNKKEIPNNGKDDDKNGYVDDVHGWNFLGDGYNEQLEYVRLVASGDTDAPRFTEAKTKLEKDYQDALAGKTQYEQIYARLKDAHTKLTAYFKKEDYTKKDTDAIKAEDNAELKSAVETANLAYANGLSSLKEAVKDVKGGVEYYSDRVNFNLNKDFKGRKTGDNPDVFDDKPGYGNGNVKPIIESESHGTHVAGIVAAERNNGKGANGVANNVKIMSLRAVPNGDEYDKDIAKAIRYAVDNGAKVINGSFGKSFSPHSDWVRDAISYAEKKDVLIVHAAGNSSENIDTAYNFPADNIEGKEVADNYISVGALSPKYGSKMVASFSNYGKQNVDVFAPGGQIYSTVPENGYEPNSGTSMAAPAVAGVAALIRSQYPKLTAQQVKNVILASGLKLTTKVIVGGDANDVRPFSELSKTGTIVNAFNALIMASKL